MDVARILPLPRLYQLHLELLVDIHAHGSSRTGEIVGVVGKPFHDGRLDWIESTRVRAEDSRASQKSVQELPTPNYSVTTR